MDSLSAFNDSDYRAPISYELIEVFSWMVPILFGLMTIIGVAGNSLVIYVIIRHGQMKTVTNYYIVNLAITDISFLLFCAPFTATLFYPSPWLFGAFLCKFVFMMMQVTATATCLTLAAMSVDRYKAIVRPLQSLRSRTTNLALSVSIAIWTASLVSSIPAILYFNLDDDVICVEYWPSWRMAYGLYGAIVLYLIPLTVISVCYALMLHKLWRRVVPGDVYNDQQNLRHKRRTTKMVLVVVLTFAICWLPVHVFSMWYRFAQQRFPVNDATYIFKVISHTLSYANSCCNPFIYAFMGENFIRYFKKAFPCCFEKNRQGVTSHAANTVT
uniref:Kisspeptin receptor n=1 Tax=Stichopus japonicus TaxID=307972 RepID=A0A5B7LIE4_STIJA|nr:kisspeptin receptor [Apostichopus japonicus]